MNGNDICTVERNLYISCNYPHCWLIRGPSMLYVPFYDEHISAAFYHNWLNLRKNYWNSIADVLSHRQIIVNQEKSSIPSNTKASSIYLLIDLLSANRNCFSKNCFQNDFYWNDSDFAETIPVLLKEVLLGRRRGWEARRTSRLPRLAVSQVSYSCPSASQMFQNPVWVD
jgi:hypothetical protein